MPGHEFKRWALLLTFIIVTIVLDQVSKALVVHHLAVDESWQPIPALADVFQITRSSNTGSAFGFLPAAGDLFLIIAVVIVGALLVFYRRIPDNAVLTRIATGLVCGGALGNALDRIHYGQVVDFIHYRIPGVISNVSNLADHAIVLGVGLILLDSWLAERREKLKAALQSAQIQPVDREDEKAHPGG